MHECLLCKRDMKVSNDVFCKREVTTLSYNDLFDGEKLEKMYLSKGKAKRILKNIENNSNWIKGEIDEKVEERLNFYVSFGIFDIDNNILYYYEYDR